MEVREQREVTELKVITIAVKCDVCEKINKESDIPSEWHGFNHHHNEWGNDSIDSYEYHDVCSPKCYWIKFKECVDDLDGYSDAKVDNFEIQFARLLIENTLTND